MIKSEFRTEEKVRQDYSDNYESQTNDFFLWRTEKCLYHGRFAIFPVIEYKRRLIKRFADIVNIYRLQSLLELGSGRGFDILSLAVLCPSLHKITGIELTSSGVETARGNLSNPPMNALEYLTGRPREEIEKRIRSVRIEYKEGSIRSLPFDDSSFDGLFSNSVMEQFPRDYGLPFAESARVAKKIAFFSEPFKEAQGGNVFKLMYLSNIDYFRGSFFEVKKAGWKIWQFEIPPLQKFLFNTGILVCRKEL